MEEIIEINLKSKQVDFKIGQKVRYNFSAYGWQERRGVITSGRHQTYNHLVLVKWDEDESNANAFGVWTDTRNIEKILN